MRPPPTDTQDAAKLQQVQALAQELMSKHGLWRWTFAWDRAKFRAGFCDYRRRLISLSQPLALLRSLEQTRDTLLHEIAHALTPGQKHNEVWKAKAKQLGCTPKRTFNLSPNELQELAPHRRKRTPKYTFTCPHCETLHKRYMKLKRGFHLCSICARKDGRRVIIRWKKVID